MTPMTQADFKDMGCEQPNCAHDHTILWVHQHCHPKADCTASYDKSDGTMTLFCAECEETITRVLIAPGLQ